MMTRVRLKHLQRDIKVFIYLFPWRMTFILLISLILATYLFWSAHTQWEGEISGIKALFAVINMTFFQLTFSDLPADERMDFFPILIPVVGLPLFSLFGFKIIHLIRIFFMRGERGEEWQMALIESSFQGHIVICGLGRIGYRVAKTLALYYDRQVVGIDDTHTALVDDLLAMDVPVIIGDTAKDEILRKCGVERASVIVACTNQDWVNLETAIQVRDINRRARIVLRLFEDELIEDFKTNFDIDAIISRSAVAAVTFAYAAIGCKVMETFAWHRQKYVLAQVPIRANSPMVAQTVGQLSDAQDMTILCHNRGETMTVEPEPTTQLAANDILFVFTTVEKMLGLIEPTASQRRILVCGLGHTGYRVVTSLQEMGCQITALDYAETRLSSRLADLGIQLKFGDLRWQSLLIEAGIRQASSIVACTEDDMTNLQIALHARVLNPQIRVVVRMFHDRLSEQLRRTFGSDAVYSTSALARPDFISAALNQMKVRFVDIEGVSQAIVRLKVTLSGLYHVPISELQAEDGLTVLLHRRNGEIFIPPRMDMLLRVDDEILVLATLEKLSELDRRNRSTQDILREGYR